MTENEEMKVISGQDGIPPTGSRMAIWPSAAPGSEAWTWTEQELVIAGDRTVRNVSTPTLEAFAPVDRPTHGAVIVAPGGGFHYLSIDHEGVEPARWLAARGYVALVLRYRVRHTPEADDEMVALDRDLAKRLEATPPSASTRERIGDAAAAARELAVADGCEAVRTVRARAREWGIDPARVGFVGFSAGASVALTAATSADPSARPDFVASLYGPRPEPMRVPTGAPDLFLAHSGDDSVVPASESVETWAAWRTVGSPAELHVFSTGGHGYGTKRQGLPSDDWLTLFEAWMGGLGLLGPSHERTVPG